MLPSRSVFRLMQYSRSVQHSRSMPYTVAFLAPSFGHPLYALPTLQCCPRARQTYCSSRRLAPSAGAARKSSSSRKRSSAATPADANADAPVPRTLVIVESPAKAATIQKILPEQHFRVRSCVGHIREIPSSAKRIPVRFKELPWARLGVDVTSDFRPIYVLISGKKAIVSDLRQELRDADRLVLATDDDREGESISWHLLEVLNPSIPVRRAVFHEITPSAITAAFDNFRDLDINLVEAQETRRVLDRLAGFTMSPLLWKKIGRGLSAGRVQSVAMAQIVNRERSRLLFKSARYASCAATFAAAGMTFQATLAAVGGVRLVRGTDFDDATGQLHMGLEIRPLHFSRADIDALIESCLSAAARVVSVETKSTTRNPPHPLITSTLQQECGNRLGMGAGKTMAIAQKLYETGLITYMRTDNPVMSEDAIKACRERIEDLYGSDALWDGSGARRGGKPRASQAAHEAIRPAGTEFPLPHELDNLSDDEHAVYSIIFRRTLASQMASAKLDQTTVKIEVSGTEHSTAEFRASGSVIVSPGFLKLYEGTSKSESSGFIPAVSEGEQVSVIGLNALEHETKPPPRFNDASLVKVLEELGVGRPSTYAGIIEKLIVRGYVYRGQMLPQEKGIPSKALVPSLTAFAVERLLSAHFPSFVDAEFTAQMEETLDGIAAGSADRVRYLKEYYGGENGLAASVERSESEIDGGVFKRIVLPNMHDDMISSAEVDALSDDGSKTGKEGYQKGKRRARSAAGAEGGRLGSESETGEPEGVTFNWAKTKVLVGSYGPYLEQDSVVVASLPKTTLADDLSPDRLMNTLRLAQDPVMGEDPTSGLQILLRTSRFGPYLQLGRDEDAEEGTKPKRCGLLPGMDVGELTLEMASKLLSLPRVLGTHPKTGLEVRAAIGPYGPYLAHNEMFVALRKNEHDVLEIELDEAVDLVLKAEERKRKRLEKLAEKEAEQAKQTAGEADEDDNEAMSKMAEGTKSAKATRSKSTKRSSKRTPKKSSTAESPATVSVSSG